MVKKLARDFGGAFVRNEVLDLAAQVAYWAILALFPFAMFVLTLMGFIPLHGLDRQVIEAVQHVAPPEAARLFETTLDEIVGNQRGWLLVSTLLFALWTAAGCIHGLATALNRAYEVPETRPIWVVRLRALLVTLIGVVASVLATTAMLVGPELVRHAWSFFGFERGFDRLWASLRWPVAILAMTSMIAFMYFYLPNVREKRRFILPGAVIAVLGWIVGSFGFQLYVAHFASYARTYGALGTVVVLLLWLYLWALMVIVGGQFNAILDRSQRHIVHTVKPPKPSRRRSFVVIGSKQTPA